LALFRLAQYEMLAKGAKTSAKGAKNVKSE
jgi:hypothetical protein